MTRLLVAELLSCKVCCLFRHQERFIIRLKSNPLIVYATHLYIYNCSWLQLHWKRIPCLTYLCLPGEPKRLDTGSKSSSWTPSAWNFLSLPVQIQPSIGDLGYCPSNAGLPGASMLPKGGNRGVRFCIERATKPPLLTRLNQIDHQDVLLISNMVNETLFAMHHWISSVCYTKPPGSTALVNRSACSVNHLCQCQ